MNKNTDMVLTTFIYLGFYFVMVYAIMHLG